MREKTEKNCEMQGERRAVEGAAFFRSAASISDERLADEMRRGNTKGTRGSWSSINFIVPTFVTQSYVSLQGGPPFIATPGEEKSMHP